jgi:hypothetical protein
MADEASELAKNITRNIVPLNAGQDVVGPYQAGENMVVKLLQQLGLMQPPAPPMNMPLPRKDPRTGQIIFPEGYKGPR